MLSGMIPQIEVDERRHNEHLDENQVIQEPQVQHPLGRQPTGPGRSQFVVEARLLNRGIESRGDLEPVEQSERSSVEQFDPGIADGIRTPTMPTTPPQDEPSQNRNVVSQSDGMKAIPAA